MSAPARLLLALLALLLVLAAPAAADTNERVKSRVLEYVSDVDDASVQRTVARIIVNGASFIQSRLRSSSATLPHLDYLKDVGVFPDGGDAVLSLSDVETYWHDSPEPVLQVLFGEFERNAGTDAAPLTIYSSIFLGDLPRMAGVANPQNRFDVVSQNRLRDYRRIADGHHLTLLYALILDALATAKPDDVVTALLNAAESTADDLQSTGLLNGDLRTISQELDAIAEGYR